MVTRLLQDDFAIALRLAEAVSPSVHAVSAEFGVAAKERKKINMKGKFGFSIPKPEINPCYRFLSLTAVFLCVLRALSRPVHQHVTSSESDSDIASPQLLASSATTPIRYDERAKSNFAGCVRLERLEWSL